VNIEPLRPDDFLFSLRITYQLKRSSTNFQRWEWRGVLKEVLGRDAVHAHGEGKGRYRENLVNAAKRFSKLTFSRG
jgi:hypothetical protein